MDQSRVRYLIAKYRAGEITADEKAALENYWNLSVGKQQKIDFLKEDEKLALKDEMFNAISAHIHASQRKESKSMSYYRVAAICIALLLSSLVLYQYGHMARLEYTTAYGQTRKVVLPDSSVVMLNANSTLRVPQYWHLYAEHRKVWLDGEAFFEVKKKRGATFSVYAGGVAVEVLGTSFNVQDRRGETRVVLNSGKVKLKLADKGQELTMQPGDLVKYMEHQKAVEQRLVDPEMYSAWKDHRLIFQDTKLEEIILILEDNFGYEVQMKDSSLANRRFTGSVPSDNMEMLLDKLSHVFNIEIQKTDRVISME